VLFKTISSKYTERIIQDLTTIELD